MSRYLFQPLPRWTDPETPQRRGAHLYKASWDDTLALLEREADCLSAKYPIVIQVAADESQIRRDGQLRSGARISHPGVAVSFQSVHGPLRYATDAYEDSWWKRNALAGWQANVRAVALSLQALRAVDRYGVSRRGEQYTGWRALTAGGLPEFPDAEAAWAWMRAYATGQLDLTLPEVIAAKDLYRLMAKLMHPDRGGPRADWDRLDVAWRLLSGRTERGSE